MGWLRDLLFGAAFRWALALFPFVGVLVLVLSEYGRDVLKKVWDVMIGLIPAEAIIWMDGTKAQQVVSAIVPYIGTANRFLPLDLWVGTIVAVLSICGVVRLVRHALGLVPLVNAG